MSIKQKLKRCEACGEFYISSDKCFCPNCEENWIFDQGFKSPLKRFYVWWECKVYKPQFSQQENWIISCWERIPYISLNH